MALGEDCWGRAALAELVAATSAQVPIVDLGYLGGPSAVQAILADGGFGGAELGVHIDALYLFPVKSLLGERVDEARVTGRGLLGDRAYGLVDVADGTVASAKHPRKWGALLGRPAPAR